MSNKFRDSEFIDFNTGTVKLAPIQLQFRTRMAGNAQFGDLVRLFQCRIEVWQLGVSVQTLRETEFCQPPSIWSHAAYGVVAILVAYFETIGALVNPEPLHLHANNPSAPITNFDCGFRDVYSDITTSLGQEYDPSEFYARARTGLFALGSTPRGLWLHNARSTSLKDFDIIQKNPDDPATRRYYINPHSTVRTLVEHFPTVIARLHDPDARYDALRAQFKAYVGVE